MATLFKYFMGIAIILPATVILCAVNMGELFVGFTEVAQAPAKETPSWKIERLKAEPDTPYVARGSLWPAAGSEDTELGVLLEREVGHGEAEVYT